MKRYHINDTDDCPCGLGTTYKDCCKNKEFYEIFKKHRESAKKLLNFEGCCVPDSMIGSCTRNDDGTINVSNAHTVTKNKSLKSIADENDKRVYHYNPESNYFTFNPYKFEKPNIKSASTFKGFCNYHDNKLFECFEKKPFKGTPEQIFFMSFRALARQYSSTKILLKSENFFNLLVQKYNPRIDNKHLSTQEIEILNLYQLSSIITNNCFECNTKTFEYYLKKFHKDIDSKNYDCLDYYLVEFKGIFPIQCCGCASPIISPKGKWIDNSLIQPFFMNYFYDSTVKRSYAMFSWYKEDTECRDLIAIYKDPMSKEALCFNLIMRNFISIDNFFIQPKWWDSIPNAAKNFLYKMLTTFDPIETLKSENEAYVILKILIKNKLLNDFEPIRHGPL